jgi:hypothetical protein
MVAGAGRSPAQYTPEETATALTTLAGNEGNLTATEKELKAQGWDISVYKLRRLRDAYPQVYELARSRLIDDLYDKTLIMTNRYADEIIRRLDDPDTLAAMKTVKLATVYGIGIDKLNVMTTVRSKSGETQKAAKKLEGLTEDDLQKAIDAEFKEIKAEEPIDDEDMSGTSEDKLPIRPGGVPSIGSFLHRSSDKGRT